MDGVIDDRTFTEVFEVVVKKMQQGIPVMGAREELMEDFICDWCEIFDEESCR